MKERARNYGKVAGQITGQNPSLYHNTSIVPHLTYDYPVARVKKIISADEEIANCSNNAAFVITIATELFIQHLVRKSHEIIRSEKKPRRNVQYNDIANAVARLDNLEFLSDVVPRTTTLKKVQAERAKKEATGAIRGAANGQRILNMGGGLGGATGHMVGPDEVVRDEDQMQIDRDPAAMQLDAEASRGYTNGSH